MGRSKDQLPESKVVDDTGGEGVVAIGSASNIYKVQVDKGLKSCMAEGSIATQIGEAKHSREILASASEALIHKMLKNRSTGDEENEVKKAVLNYIGAWLGTSKSTE